MARTDKRKGRVKYIKLPALMADNQLRALYGRFWDHPSLESVLICEGYRGITGSVPLDAGFDRWLAAEHKKHRDNVADFKKKSPAEYGQMLQVIGTNEGDGVDPRRRIAIEEYHKTPLAIHAQRGVVYAVKPTRLLYVKGTGKKVGKKLKGAKFKVEQGIVHWRFRPALDFQRHLEKLFPRYFPATETAESFMMFAKRAGLRFVGPKNAKTRIISKRRKQ